MIEINTLSTAANYYANGDQQFAAVYLVFIPTISLQAGSRALRHELMAKTRETAESASKVSWIELKCMRGSQKV